MHVTNYDRLANYVVRTNFREEKRKAMSSIYHHLATQKERQSSNEKK
jgi:hypothetical protein